MMKKGSILLTGLLLGMISLAFGMAGLLSSPVAITAIIISLAFAIAGLVLVMSSRSTLPK